jgi:hypothetical protein
MEDSARQFLIDELRKNRDRILALVEPLTQEQLNFKPAEDRWSIHQVLEHVVTVESRVLGFVQEKAKGVPEHDKRSPVEDSALLAALVDRTTRRQAPETATPRGQWPNGEAVTEFSKVRGKSSEFAAANTANLRQFFQPHGAFGEIDCYQWMMLLSSHGERHVRQIEEIQAALGYPQTAAATA